MSGPKPVYGAPEIPGHPWRLIRRLILDFWVAFVALLLPLGYLMWMFDWSDFEHAVMLMLVSIGYRVWNQESRLTIKVPPRTKGTTPS